MKKENMGFYIFSTLLLVSIIMLKNLYIFTIFWVLVTIGVIIKYGFPKDKSFYKKNTIRVVVISLISYFLITYSLGILLGFSKNVYNLSFKNMILNIASPLIVSVCIEIIRYIYAKNSQYRKKKYVYLTIILIVLSIIMEFNTSYLENFEKKFVFISLVVLPIIDRECVYSYLTYKVSFVPSLIMRLALGLNVYILPIFPNLGNYLNSVIGVLFPVLIYLSVSKTIKYYDKDNSYVALSTRKYLLYPFMIIAVILIFLVSGLGNYKLVAIASGSMEPIYYRGDAVIYKKINDIEEIKLGTIIAYNSGGSLITHRVVSISKDNDGYVFRTKGDNNNSIDGLAVGENQIEGIVVYKIGYIGRPTLWLQEVFGNV